MNNIQTELKVLLEKDGWEVFQTDGKRKLLIMQKKIDNVMFYISINPEGAVHFNRRK